MAIEIVDFPIKNGGSFHGKMLVHQRVNNDTNPIKSIQHYEGDPCWSVTTGIPVPDTLPGCGWLTPELKWDLGQIHAPYSISAYTDTATPNISPDICVLYICLCIYK